MGFHLKIYNKNTMFRKIRLEKYVINIIFRKKHTHKNVQNL